MEVHPYAACREVLQAAKDLRAKSLLPVHSSKFALANHAWDEPLRRITALHIGNSFKIITPKIGETVFLNKSDQSFAKWWLEVE